MNKMDDYIKSLWDSIIHYLRLLVIFLGIILIILSENNTYGELICGLLRELGITFIIIGTVLIVFERYLNKYIEFKLERIESVLQETNKNVVALNPLTIEFNTLKDVVKKTGERCIASSNKSIDTVIANYTRDELIAFIMECSIKHLNRFEGINKDGQISKLYQKHGLLELANEPRRTKLKLKYINEKEIEDNKILLNIVQSYTATNEASEESSKNKLLNKDGLVAYVSLDLKNLDEIKNTLKYLTGVLRYNTSFLGEHQESNEITLSPLLLSNDDEQKIESGNFKGRTTKIEMLRGVYKISKKQDGYYLLELSLILDIEIPPKGMIDIHVETKVPVLNFNLWTYEFVSWTDSVDLELRKFDSFETDISYVLPGVSPNDKPSDLTKTKLEYKRWIMPHSSISVAWAKKNV